MSNQNPIITIEMENGDIMKAELYPEIAPNTVNNFISLIKKGFYDGVGFHRIIPGFMIQGGDPQGTEWAVLDTASRVSFQAMDSRMSFSIQRECFQWHVQ